MDIRDALREMRELAAGPSLPRDIWVYASLTRWADAIEAAILEKDAEIDQLQRKLMLVTNFPSHPGGHPDDQSGDAMVPEDWRHGWICAVAAIQEAVAGKEEA